MDSEVWSTPAMQFLLSLYCVAMGLAIGSFLNVVIYRLPLGESLVSPSSRCPHCGHAISALENIPVLSFLALRGRCYHCQIKISWRYPAVEALTGFVFFLAWQRYGFSVLTPLYMSFAAALIAAALIDFDHQIIPDEISVGGFLAGLVFVPLAYAWSGQTWRYAFEQSVLGALIGAGLLWAASFIHARMSVAMGRSFEHWPGEGETIPKPCSADYWLWFPGMGLGDVKLFAMIGAFLGPFDVLEVLLAAAGVGLCFGLAWGLMTRRWATPLGFGPAIAIGAIYTAIRPDAWSIFRLLA